MKVVCSICARGGSKGVKNKNVRLLNGKPLIQHTIEQVKAAGIFDCIVVSSDSSEILSVAKDCGVDFIIERPDELATDKAAKIPVIQHAFLEAEKLSGKKFDISFDLDATSPLRNVEDILGVFELIKKEEVANVITGAPSRRSPYFNLVEELPNGDVALSKSHAGKNFVRRQDVPNTYDMNASIYAWKRDVLLNNEILFLEGTKIFVMPEERSQDIDSEIDFRIVEMFMKENGN